MKTKLNRTILASVALLAGGVIRLIYPFVHNPMDYQLVSDTLRHAGGVAETPAIMSILDPPLYKLWTGVLLAASDKILVAALCAGLSLATPLLYYLLLRSCIRSRALALLGAGIIAMLPSWICYSSYFMQENLLLPLTALALLLSFRAGKHKGAREFFLAAFFWGAAVNAKATALPLFMLVWAGLCHYCLKEGATRKLVTTICASSILAILLCLVSPLLVWQRLGIFLPVPQEPFNRAYFESGRQVLALDCSFVDRKKPESGILEQSIRIETPAIYDPPLRPFAYWRTGRQGTAPAKADLTGNTAILSGIEKPCLKRRLELTFENAVYLLLGDTWPVDDESPQGILNRAASWSRFLWSPLIVLLSYSFIALRLRSPATALCLAYLAFLLLQQSVVMEGRYRMVWEGLAIVALIESIDRLRCKKQSSDNLEAI
ncbi:MAG: glycosyltransferase family 39 protein [Candidatus Melainabacteria bacterium]|nr:glycosyltransferase family 39 protein [Candidatus Melainabacteria bacterium]